LRVADRDRVAVGDADHAAHDAQEPAIPGEQ
jgi:hypothetical protein